MKNYKENDYQEKLRDEKACVTMFMMNGFQMQGIITSIDGDTIFFKSDGRNKEVYKHAISTMVNHSERFFQEHLGDKEDCVNMIMMNGFQMQGVITACDDNTILFTSNGKEHQVYKHAISTIVR